jgi:hypothetical protein
VKRKSAEKKTLAQKKYEEKMPITEKFNFLSGKV